MYQFFFFFTNLGSYVHTQSFCYAFVLLCCPRPQITPLSKTQKQGNYCKLCKMMNVLPCIDINIKTTKL